MTCRWRMRTARYMKDTIGSSRAHSKLNILKGIQTSKRTLQTRESPLVCDNIEAKKAGSNARMTARQRSLHDGESKDVPSNHILDLDSVLAAASGKRQVSQLTEQERRERKLDKSRKRKVLQDRKDEEEKVKCSQSMS